MKSVLIKNIGALLTGELKKPVRAADSIYHRRKVNELFELWCWTLPTEPLQKMIRLAKLSEDLGYSHVWIGDSHLIWREAYVNMTAVALNTTKVRIGTGVTNPLTQRQFRGNHGAPAGPPQLF